MVALVMQTDSKHSNTVLTHRKYMAQYVTHMASRIQHLSTRLGILYIPTLAFRQGARQDL